MNAPTRFGPAGMPAGMDPQEWRRAIEAEVDKLLDRADALVVALDAMEADPDLEDSGDGEESLGWGEVGPKPFNQANVGEREADGADDEHTLGWTEDQSACGRLSGGFYAHKDGEIEPSLGFVGHGTGWREGETNAEENGDEGDCDETDTPGFIAGGNEEGERSHSYGHAASGPAKFDGSGVAEAKQALRNAGPRIVDEVTRTIGERCHVLPGGDILRTAVPYLSGYVRPSGALPDEDGPDMTDFSAYAPRRGGDGESRL